MYLSDAEALHDICNYNRTDTTCIGHYSDPYVSFCQTKELYYQKEYTDEIVRLHKQIETLKRENKQYKNTNDLLNKINQLQQQQISNLSHESERYKKQNANFQIQIEKIKQQCAEIRKLYIDIKKQFATCCQINNALMTQPNTEIYVGRTFISESNVDDFEDESDWPPPSPRIDELKYEENESNGSDNDLSSTDTDILDVDQVMAQNVMLESECSNDVPVERRPMPNAFDNNILPSSLITKQFTPYEFEKTGTMFSDIGKVYYGNIVLPQLIQQSEILLRNLQDQQIFINIFGNAWNCYFFLCFCLISNDAFKNFYLFVYGSKYWCKSIKRNGSN